LSDNQSALIHTALQEDIQVKFTTAAAVAALALMLGTPAFAQSSGNAAGATSVQSMRTSSLIGKTVIGDHGGDLCTIADVLLKPDGSEPTVIVSLTTAGQGGSKLIALPLSKVTLEGDRPKIAGVTRQALEEMPPYNFTYGG